MDRSIPLSTIKPRGRHLRRLACVGHSAGLRHRAMAAGGTRRATRRRHCMDARRASDAGVGVTSKSLLIFGMRERVGTRENACKKGRRKAARSPKTVEKCAAHSRSTLGKNSAADYTVCSTLTAAQHTPLLKEGMSVLRAADQFSVRSVLQ